MGFKENTKKAIEWGKKNPIVVLAIFGGIVFIFMRRDNEYVPADSSMAQMEAIRGGAFVQPYEKGNLREPDLYPEQHDEIPREAPTEAPREAPREVPREATTQNQMRSDEIFTTRGDPHYYHIVGNVAYSPWRANLDHAIVGHTAYTSAIARTHSLWQPGTPTRPQQNGLLLTTKGWETPQEIEARQQLRYQAAVNRGDAANAAMVRQETEITTGRRVGW